MSKLRVMTVFGTRPEAIKMAPLVLELNKEDEIEQICCVSAQHRELLDSVLEVFNIKPDYDLDIMKPSQSLSQITGRTLAGMERVYEDIKPDMVLVHGDTSTTFAGALAAFYHKIQVGHVEAGLRTFDKYSPYPEEMNRCLTGKIANLHFCPTKLNASNLEREGITQGVFITGNTVIDAIGHSFKKDYKFKNKSLASIDFSSRRVIFLTAHRRENYGQPFLNIFSAVNEITSAFPDCLFVYPVHPSPAVKETAYKAFSKNERVLLIDPLPIDETYNLMARCYMAMTDSGGLQEEVPAFGKPVLVLRRETERPEAIQAGTVKLSGVERENIIRDANTLLSSSEEYNKMARAVNPYGDGQASRRITQAILWHYGRGERPEQF